MSNFKNLHVWHKAINLAKKIYLLSADGKLSKDFGFRDQIRRSSVSIASNIAEGDESGTDKMAIRFFHIAKGSSAELFTQVIIADKIGYISSEDKESLLRECEAISGMLYRLIESRQ
jgi:four helix bundle protein